MMKLGLAMSWYLGAALVGAALCLYGFGFDPNPVRFAELGALTVLGIVGWAFFGGPSKKLSTLTWPALALLAFAGLSLLWSPDWRDGALRLHNIVVVAGAGLVLLHLDRDKLMRWVPVVASLAIAGGIFLCATDVIYDGNGNPYVARMFGNENFEAEWFILIMPLAALGWVTWRNSIVGMACGLAAAAALIWLAGFNAADAKWVGLAGMGLAVLLWCRAYRTVVFTAGPAVIAAALYVHNGLQTGGWTAWKSVLSRAEIAYNTALMWLDHPILGTGLGGYNYLYPLYQERHVGLIDSHALHELSFYIGAAHNEYLQALVVLGVAGAGLAGWLLWAIWKERANDPAGLVGAATLGALAGLCLVGFPLQNAATALIAVSGLALTVTPQRVYELNVKWLSRATALGLAISTIWVGVMAIRGGTYFAYATLLYNTNAVGSLKAATLALKASPWDARYRSQIIASLGHLQEVRPKHTIIKQSAWDRAYAAARTAGPYSASVLTFRAAHLLKSGRWRKSDELDSIIAQLKAHARTNPETWMLIAYRAGLSGQREEAIKALVIGLEHGGKLEHMQKVANAINLRIERNGR